MQDIIATMQKHINNQFQANIPSLASKIKSTQNPHISANNSATKSSIVRFGEDIKGANEFIGALQSASVAIRKLLNITKNAESSQNITQNLQEIVDSASFMGFKLFGAELSTQLNAKHYTMHLENPLSLYNATDSSAFVGFLDEKIKDINALLLELSEALSAPKSQAHNFNHFDKQAFRDMLKG